MGFDDVILAKYNMLDKIDHVHTPGNSSGIVDGASAVMVGSEKAGNDLGPQAPGTYSGDGRTGDRSRDYADGARTGCQKVPR